MKISNIKNHISKVLQRIETIFLLVKLILAFLKNCHCETFSLYTLYNDFNENFYIRKIKLHFLSTKSHKKPFTHYHDLNEKRMPLSSKISKWILRVKKCMKVLKLNELSYRRYFLPLDFYLKINWFECSTTLIWVCSLIDANF